LNNTTQDKALKFNSFLILFAFSLYFGIINLLQSIGKSIIELTINNQNLNQISSSITSVLVDFVFLLLFIILMYLFLKKKRLFLKIYICTLITFIVLYIYTYTTIEDISYFIMILKLSVYFGLLLYFIKSQDVKQTFIN
jgi:hypothetical protein